MTALSVSQALANATSAMVRNDDVYDVLSGLVTDCCELLGATATGLLIVGTDGGLELMAATSHRAAELESFQVQQHSGPCVEAVSAARAVEAAGDLEQRWPVVGAAMSAAGFHGVAAYPLWWHGHTVGALNVFYAEVPGPDEQRSLLGQAFADIAAVVVVQATELAATVVGARLGAALRSRTVIEQAKGILAYQQRLAMDEAYVMLLGLARDSGRSVSTVARELIARASSRAT